MTIAIVWSNEALLSATAESPTPLILRACKSNKTKNPNKTGVLLGLEDGAKNGARTRDPQNHNLLLYQLSYFRHQKKVQ